MVESEYHFETSHGPFHYTLRVDENSSIKEIEAEIEYWTDQMYDFNVEGEYRKAIIGAIRWMNVLAEEQRGV